MSEFEFTEILPLGKDETEYRLVTTHGVSTFETPQGTFLKVSPEAITRITQEAMREIAHLHTSCAQVTCSNYETFLTILRPATMIALSPWTS
ncbi:MAG: hypothetical protein RL688_987 [Actinomycetota bacterium]